MFEIGRLVVKIAGRDAGLKGVIIDKLNDNYVLIDGQVRRRKCNIKHLEPLNKVIKIKKNASHKEVVDALKKLKIEVKERKPKKDKPPRPRKQRKSKKKEKQEKEATKKEKAEKKQERISEKKKAENKKE